MQIEKYKMSIINEIVKSQPAYDWEEWSDEAMQ